MKIGYDNLIDDATTTFTSEDANYPWDTALGDSRLSRTGRFTDCSAEYLEFGFSSNVTSNLVSVLGSNLTTDAEVYLLSENSDYKEVWTERDVDSMALNFYCITFGNNLFVAGGIYGQIITSTDGSTWTIEISPSTSKNALRSATYSSDFNLYVFGDTAGYFHISTDGSTWTDIAGASTNNDIFGLAYSPDFLKFVAGGENGIVQTSTDGSTWTLQAGASTLSINDVCYGNNLYIAVGFYNLIQTSTDGSTWTLETGSGSTSNSIKGIAYSSDLDLYVAVGEAGEIQTSTDGSTWTIRNPADGYTHSFEKVRWGDDRFVAVGSYLSTVTMDFVTVIQTSTNGIDWTSQTGDTGNLYDCAYGNNAYVIADASIAIQASLEIDLTSSLNQSGDVWWANFTSYDSDTWRILFLDPTNTDGYIELGFVFLGEALDMPYMKRSQTIEDLTTARITVSDGGQAYGDDGYNYRSPNVEFPYLTHSQREEIRTMFENVKNYKPVFVVIWPDSTYEDPMYCIIDQTSLRFERTDDINMQWKTTLKFREVY